MSDNPLIFLPVSDVTPIEPLQPTPADTLYAAYLRYVNAEVSRRLWRDYLMADLPPEGRETSE